MSDVTRILSDIERGDPNGAERLLPLVYDELRKLAAQRMAQERPGQTLQATALVHEAYVRLVDDANDRQWDGRGHFFAAAAEAMRRILVDAARRRDSLKRGGDLNRVLIDIDQLADSGTGDDLLELDEALEKFASVDPKATALVKLKFFGGLKLRDAAAALGIPPRTADSLWAYSRAWLYKAISESRK
jgi:RNA polymerase sigma factor (TIGR02999 family)